MWVVYLACERLDSRTPLFYERDESFRTYIRERVQVTDNPRNDLSNELDKVWYMFSHIILSNAQLARSVSGLRNIECENGFKVVLKQPADDVVLIAGSSSDVDGLSMSEVERRLDTLLALLKFLYGPSYDYHLSLGSSLEQKRANWDEISLLLNKWNETCEIEQCYLVEAVEELCMTSTNIGSKAGRLNDASNETFEAVLTMARRIIKSRLGCTYDYVVHSMLVVENKIVKFNSSEKDRLLSPYDMLLILLVSMSYFPSNLIPEDLYSQPHRRERVATALVQDSEDDFAEDAPSNPETRRDGERYYSNTIIEEDPSDSPSMLSAFSSEFRPISSSDSPGSGTTRKFADFLLGDEKLSAIPVIHVKKGSEASNSDNNDNELSDHMQLPANTLPGLIPSAFISVPEAKNILTSQGIRNSQDQNCFSSSLPELDQSWAANNEAEVKLLNCAVEKKSEIEFDPSAISPLHTENDLVVDSHLPTDGPEPEELQTAVASENELEQVSLLSTHAQEVCQPCSENVVNGLSAQLQLESANNELSAQVGGSLTEELGPREATFDQWIPNGDLPNYTDDVFLHDASSAGPRAMSACLDWEPGSSQAIVDDNNTVDDYTSISSVETLKPSLNLEQLAELECADISRARSVTDCVQEGHNSPDITKQTETCSSPHSGFLSTSSGHSSIRHTSLSSSFTNQSPAEKRSSTASRAITRGYSVPRRGVKSLTSMDGRSMSVSREQLSVTPILSQRTHSLDRSHSGRLRHGRGIRRDSSIILSDKDDEYYSSPTPPLCSPILPQRRPSVDSATSYATAPQDHHNSGGLLDTVSLLSNVQRRSNGAHMAKDVFVHKRVFLRSSLCDYIPACLYVISISKGINVVVAAEITEPQRPNKIVEVMNNLRHLLHPFSNTENKQTSERAIIDRMADRLKEVFELLSARDPKGVYKKTCDDMLVLWLRIAPVIRKCYKNSSMGDKRRVPEKEEGNILTMLTGLKKIFRSLYMNLAELVPDKLGHFESIQLKASRRLAVYKQILLVKAKRNLAMSAFENEKYPGLVHFIYVYRNKNILKSPSVEQPAIDGSIKAAVIKDMKVRLWRIVPWIYKQLANGYTSISVKDGDFVFTFDLFMYDEVHYKFLPKALTNSSLYSPPKSAIGDLRGEFYKRLLHLTDTSAGYKCLELLTVHFAVMPKVLIKKQRKQLLVNELHKKHDPFGNNQ